MVNQKQKELGGGSSPRVPARPCAPDPHDVHTPHPHSRGWMVILKADSRDGSRRMEHTVCIATLRWAMPSCTPQGRPVPAGSQQPAVARAAPSSALQVDICNLPALVRNPKTNYTSIRLNCANPSIPKSKITIKHIYQINNVLL